MILIFPDLSIAQQVFEVNTETPSGVILNVNSYNEAEDGRIAIEYNFDEEDLTWLKDIIGLEEQEDGSWIGDEGIKLVSELPSDWDN